ncbi:hypothetical protein BDP81DRAFT_388078 [Colletotrichum phormii]|uniref:Uncharacterized protein n=1 Tax=Colletotrichum phormii TaxID=359342 RepID=A0AAI9ZDD1_9PEZI|nr:uncharacterized protein BDP81DRAFT_388078 [Colletotrichum phormii]KAK1613489.1 hypothetical protein BDP81DRAFT_388078 [Colletotrichum phormii]
MSGNQFLERNTRSPSVFDISETDESDDGDSSPQSRSAANQDDVWMSRLSEPPDPEYNDPQPAHVPYSVEWKLTANNRMVTKDSEQTIVVPPDVFWKTRLRAKLRALLDRKLPSTKTFEAVDTDVVVSVTDRSQRDLVKRFDELDVDWAMLEAQLQRWSHLTRLGKSLRIDLSFNYKQTRLSSDRSARQGTKRGRQSVSDQMLSDRDLQLSAEQSSDGLPSVWPEVYNLMRCTGPPCRAGSYCWRDSTTSRHYRLKTQPPRNISPAWHGLLHVEHGGVLQGHDDVPQFLRHQLYAEEQQERDRQRKRTMSSVASNSTTQTNEPSLQSLQAHSISPSASMTTATVLSSLPNGLDVPGLRDYALREYSDWQCSKVRGEDLKMEFRKACDLALKDGLDLELIHKDPDPNVFIEGGVRRGIAMRFVGDVEDWVKYYSHD